MQPARNGENSTIIWTAKPYKVKNIFDKHVFFWTKTKKVKNTTSWKHLDKVARERGLLMPDLVKCLVQTLLV